MSVEEVETLSGLCAGVASLDAPLSGYEDFTIEDTIQADLSVEDETIDKCMRNTLKMNYGAL